MSVATRNSIDRVSRSAWLADELSRRGANSKAARPRRSRIAVALTAGVLVASLAACSNGGAGAVPSDSEVDANGALSGVLLVKDRGMDGRSGMLGIDLASGEARTVLPESWRTLDAGQFQRVEAVAGATLLSSVVGDASGPVSELRGGVRDGDTSFAFAVPFEPDVDPRAQTLSPDGTYWLGTIARERFVVRDTGGMVVAEGSFERIGSPPDRGLPQWLDDTRIVWLNAVDNRVFVASVFDGEPPRTLSPELGPDERLVAVLPSGDAERLLLRHRNESLGTESLSILPLAGGEPTPLAVSRGDPDAFQTLSWGMEDRVVVARIGEGVDNEFVIPDLPEDFVNTARLVALPVDVGTPHTLENADTFSSGVQVLQRREYELAPGDASAEPRNLDDTTERFDYHSIVWQPAG